MQVRTRPMQNVALSGTKTRETGHIKCFYSSTSTTAPRDVRRESEEVLKSSHKGGDVRQDIKQRRRKKQVVR